MTKQRYEWKRFWYPRGTHIELSDYGYLPNHQLNAPNFHNSTVVPFEAIANIPCLVLIGEPGIGKSTALEEAFSQVPEGEKKYLFELGDYGFDTELCQHIFRNSEFQAWSEGTNQLFLFLDSFDEGYLSIKQLSKILSRELKKISHACPRLHFRITCRTNDWSSILEETLKELWGENNVGVYQLAPLRRVDVIEAARKNDLDDNHFLQEIFDKEAVPLAIKPITLNFLLDIYKQTQQFPNTRKELYLKGCEHLCKEYNQNRIDSGFLPQLTPKQLLIVAARIAAITIFCDRHLILRKPEHCPAEYVDIQELWGNIEKAEGNEFKISRNEIEEALATALFSSGSRLLSPSDTHSIGFAHKTYAEFLAAWYLEQNQMPLPQIMSLIRHPDGKLVPQLHETAAWLANLLPEVFREIMKTDPDVLLKSDVATANVEDRAKLVETLLKLYDEEQILERPLENYGHYRKLAHPTLAEQLQPYIRDLNKKEQARLVAIDIAEVCQLQELKDDLVDVVIEDLEPIMIRLGAAQAIDSINDTQTKNKLKSLVFRNITNDHNSRLRLYLLDSLFPDCLNIEELFNVLTDSTFNSSSGLYDYKLASKLRDYLQTGNLLVSIDWIEKNQVEVNFNFLWRFKRITDTILLKAFENIEIEGVPQALAQVLISQLRHYEQIMNHADDSQFLQALGNDDGKRRKILLATLPLLSNLQEDLDLLAYSSTPLVFTKDIPWMIKYFQTSISEQKQQVIAQLIFEVFNSQEKGHLDTIRSISQNNQILAKIFDPYLSTDSTSSNMPQAKKEGEFLVLEEPSVPSDLEPLPAEQIIKLLDEFGDDNLTAWEHICREMVLKPESFYYQLWEMEKIDLTVLPGWISADTQTKERIVEAAQKYLLQHHPENYPVSSVKNSCAEDLFGYKALRLLLKQNLSFIEGLSTNVWQKWTPFVLAYSPIGNTEDNYFDNELLKRAYINSSDTFFDTLRLLINEENEVYDSIFIIGKLEKIWDSDVAGFLLQTVKNQHLKPKSLEDILSQLLKHDVTEAKVFAESLIPLPLPINEEERTRAVMAAQALMKYSGDAGWTTIGSAIQQDPQFGVEVIEEVSFFARNSGNIESRLLEEQVAELYIWLTETYPQLNITKRNQSPNSNPIYNKNLVTPEVSIDRWKELILSYLKERGTPQAYEALQQIYQSLPEIQKKLKPLLIESQESIRRETWVPARPEEIIELAKNHQSRLVKSGNDLLNIVIESLDELQQSLQGETPAAMDLWNEIKLNQTKQLTKKVLENLKDKLENPTDLENLWKLKAGDWRNIRNESYYMPKEEERISDYIKRYLEKTLKPKGIILNREVEIRKNELTDIYVNAVIKNSIGEVYDSVSVIIEVKGCWNKADLNTSMKTQLVERYLKHNRCQHGLYLVGWFNCDQWDESDYRKHNAPKISLEEAQQQFNVQATQLSQQGVQVKAYILNAALR